MKLREHRGKLAYYLRLQREAALSPIAAIIYVFGSLAPQAITVAACESGGGVPANINIWATNGQYVNMFQMGTSEREHFGWHVAGSAPIVAARAAFNYFQYSLRVNGDGWYPWECKP